MITLVPSYNYETYSIFEFKELLKRMEIKLENGMAFYGLVDKCFTGYPVEEDKDVPFHIIGFTHIHWFSK